MTRPDLQAIERNTPKIFDVENKITLRSSMVSEIKKWVTGEKYELEDVKLVQLASRELEDGTIESEFEITSVEVED